MIQITDQFIKDHIDFPELIENLATTFKKNSITCPPKSVYDYRSTVSTNDNTMIIMPAWDDLQYFGVKLITATPSNEKTKLPYLNGTYLMFDAQTGVLAVSMDAKLITHIRTAATSVLATTFLAKPDSSSVLIIGNGNISPYYIRAYSSMEHIQTIYLWGRNYSKSKAIVNTLESLSAKVKAIEDFKEVISGVDIISCITSATSPIVQTNHIRPGQHLDLAGSYTPEMIEVTTDVVAQASIYVDNYDVTPHHAGELVQAMQEQKLKETAIAGDLAYLCSTALSKRKTKEEITLFKSTGMAVEDLVIGKLLLEKYNKRKESAFAK